MAEIVRHAGPAYREGRAGQLDGGTGKVLRDIARCHTPELGGVLYRCNSCGHVHVRWKPCGNRHCPSCQGDAARKWIAKQVESVLPAPHFHIVLTIPIPIKQLAFHNRRILFNIMFRAAAETLRVIAADRKRFGADIGGTAVLHTWNQKMEWHPHLHCVVPNGGFDTTGGEWKRGSDAFFAPVKVLASYFRRRVCEEVKAARDKGELRFPAAIAHLADDNAFRQHLATARRIDWNVYAKRPFNGHEAVIRYLGRYTHRIAISDARILSFDGASVTFRHRKPRTKGQQTPTYGAMTLPADQFIMRYLMHVLPKGFHRIRHFGICSNSRRAKTLQLISGIERPDETVADEAAKTDEQDTEQDAKAPFQPACPKCGQPSSALVTLAPGTDWTDPANIRAACAADPFRRSRDPPKGQPTA